MQGFLITITVIIGFFILSAAIKGANRKYERAKDRRAYYKQMKQSSGMEKAVLKIRNGDTNFINCVPDDILATIMVVYKTLTDTYYTYSYTLMKDVGLADKMDEIGESLIKNFDKETQICARVYGVSFAIILYKASLSVDGAIDPKKLKRYIDNHFENEYRHKNDVYKASLYTLDYLGDPISGLGQFASWENGAIANMLLDKITQKGNYADINLATCSSIAIKKAFEKMSELWFDGDQRACMALELIATDKKEVNKLKNDAHKRRMENLKNPSIKSHNAKSKESKKTKTKSKNTKKK